MDIDFEPVRRRLPEPLRRLARRRALRGDLGSLPAVVGLLVACAGCGSPNPYRGVDEPLYRGRPAAFWIEELRYDLPRGYDTEVVPAIAHLAAVDETARYVLGDLLVDRDGDVRRRAFAALADVDPEFVRQYENVLLAGLHDAEPATAAQALQSLVVLHARGVELVGLRPAIQSLARRTDLEWAPALDQAARHLVGPDAVGGGEPELGLTIAETTLRLAARQDPAYLDTLAWAHYRAGDTERAVSLARQALGEAANLPAKQRARFDASLARFTGE